MRERTMLEDRLGSVAKIQRDLGYRPQVALEAGLRSTVAWYLERADSLRTGWQRTLS